MFEYIKGNIAYKKLNYLVVDVGGLGYKITASANTLAQVMEGEMETIFIHPIIREDAFDLYGFASVEERNMFRLLITISGIGPKAALSILSILPPNELALAIVTGDSKRISTAQGVGAKTAARVVLELQSKLTKEQATSAFSSSSSSAANSNANVNIAEAELALLALGFSPFEVKDVLANIAADSTSELIKLALNQLSN